MTKPNLKNEKAKRRYFKWMRGPQGNSEATVDAIEKSILLYEDFTGNQDFADFSQKLAIAFKKFISDRKHKGKPISTTTIYNYLRYLKGYFNWLSDQPGYKSRISRDNVSYLSLSKKKVKEATARRLIRIPSLEYVCHLVYSIKVETEFDKRDRALIAFLLLSGMRVKALSTLPLGCFDRQNLNISQDPRYGVETKSGKLINGTLFRFDDDLINIVIEWATYLESFKLFANTDPLFPRNKVSQVDGGFSFESVEVEPIFWKNANSIREILKSRSKNAGLKYYPPIHFAMRQYKWLLEVVALRSRLKL